MYISGFECNNLVEAWCWDGIAIRRVSCKKEGEIISWLLRECIFKVSLCGETNPKDVECTLVPLTQSPKNAPNAQRFPALIQCDWKNETKRAELDLYNLEQKMDSVSSCTL